MEKYDHNSFQESILYLDANNLYGESMTQYLPYGDFEWNTDEWNADKVIELSNTGEKGYLFEVDIHYPDSLHDLHNGYALGPVSQSVKKDNLNSWQQVDYKESSIKKLITSFEDKNNYIVNYRLLKLFIQQGLKITKFHKVLEYSQDNYMASYIMKNTNMRKHARNDFERDLFKLLNNSVYGKTMEDTRKRINFRLVSSSEKAMAVRNTRIKFTIFNENCVGLHMCKQEVKLNKPIYIGQNVLDDSKNLMCNFHYNVMLKEFSRENIDLLFTDTDSLCYHIKSKNTINEISENPELATLKENRDPYQFMYEKKELFDLSNYPSDHKLYDPTNEKVIGKFKSESINQITEIVCLRSKLYSFKKEKLDNAKDKLVKKTCKGIKKYVVKQDITFEDYKNTQENRKSKEIDQNTIRSYKHQLYTERITKTALSCNDDKCYIENDNINCKTFGHYKIRK